jgi:hypothetical protein
MQVGIYIGYISEQLRVYTTLYKGLEFGFMCGFHVWASCVGFLFGLLQAGLPSRITWQDYQAGLAGRISRQDYLAGLPSRITKQDYQAGLPGCISRRGGMGGMGSLPSMQSTSRISNKNLLKETQAVLPETYPMELR